MSGRCGIHRSLPQRQLAKHESRARRTDLRADQRRELRRATSSSASITQLNARDTLAFDYSNQFSQFQIPINTDPNNLNDPIVSVPGHAGHAARIRPLREPQLHRNLARRQRRLSARPVVALDADGLRRRPRPTTYWARSRTSAARRSPGVRRRPTPTRSTPSACSRTRSTRITSVCAFPISARPSITRGRSASTSNRRDRDSDADLRVLLRRVQRPGPQGDPSIPPVHEPPYYAAIPPRKTRRARRRPCTPKTNGSPTPTSSFNYGMRYDHSTGYTQRLADRARASASTFPTAARTSRTSTTEILRRTVARRTCATRASCSRRRTRARRRRRSTICNPRATPTSSSGWSHSFNSHFIRLGESSSTRASSTFSTRRSFSTRRCLPSTTTRSDANTGVELRLQNRLPQGDNWFVTATVSGSYAGGISGSTFLFPPGVNPPGIPITSPSLWSLEDHSQDRRRHGRIHAPLRRRPQSGSRRCRPTTASGFPVQFEDANVNLNGTLPAHTTFDLLLGRTLTPGPGNQDQGLGVQVGFLNLLNHQYVIKVANGFNTTQIANGRTITLRLLAPF